MANENEETSVAPDERFVLKYHSKADGGTDVEIPLRLMVVGPFSSRDDGKPISERKPQSVDKNNFDAVMRSKDLRLNATVKNHLGPNPELSVELLVESLKDLEPDGIVDQVPALRRQMQLRDILKNLKSMIATPEGKQQLRDWIDKALKDESIRKGLG